jgi:hypothetical protein
VGAAVKRYSTAFHRRPFHTSLRHEVSGVDADLGSLLAIRVPIGSDRGADLFNARGPLVPYAGVRTGFSLRGALGTEIDLSTTPGGVVPLGRQFHLGVALEAGTAGWRRLGPVLAGSLAADLVGDLDLERHRPTRCFGLELRVLDLVALRYGETRDERMRFKGVSRGLGVNLGLPGRAGIHLDWARASYPTGAFRPGVSNASRADQFTGSIWFLP